MGNPLPLDIISVIINENSNCIFWDSILIDSIPDFSHFIGMHDDEGNKINNISDDPLEWWHSNSVRKAKTYFCDNVCLTLPASINKWSEFINSKK